LHAFVLQEWTTIRSGGATVTQSEQEWLDLEPYQDVTFWLQVSEVSGSTTPTLTYQTSPTLDEPIFQAMTTGLALAASASPVVTQVFMLSATVPLARYVRWQLTVGGAASYDATFRIMVAANSPGL
jgi:hypothetical protein